MSSIESTLFNPLKIGPCNLSSRIIMGPLSSNLANAETNVLAPSAISYYSSRACVSGTLIIGEATFISAQASGTTEPRAGIWNPEQVTSWKAVVKAVHEAGSFMFLQLWALGRSADPELKQRQGTGDVVSSSAVPEIGGSVPRSLSQQEILQYVSDYAEAARTAVEQVGFDGVELHGANGSLIDQFTQDCVNKRTDQWGGSFENRSRFALEITRAVCNGIGPERVGLRVSPWSTYNSMGMPPEKTRLQFLHLLKGLKELKIAYLHLVESRVAGRVDAEAREGESLQPFLEFWWDRPKTEDSTVILAGGFSPHSAKTAVDKTYPSKDVAIAFGRAFVTNPDLVQKLKDDRDLTE